MDDSSFVDNVSVGNGIEVPDIRVSSYDDDDLALAQLHANAPYYIPEADVETLFYGPLLSSFLQDNLGGPNASRIVAGDHDGSGQNGDWSREIPRASHGQEFAHEQFLQPRSRPILSTIQQSQDASYSMQPTARDRDLTYAMEAPAFSYTSPMSTKVNPSPSLPLPYRTTVYSTAQNSSDSFSEARITPERLPTLQIDQIPMNALSISFPSTPDNVVYGGALSPGEPLWLGLNVDMAGSADGYRSYLSHVPPADIKCPPSSPGDDLLSPFSGESSGSPGSASDYMSSPACESPSSPSPIRGRGVSRSAPASRRSSPYSFSHVTRHHRHRSADESIDDMRLEDIARPVVGSSNMMRANHSKRRSEATWECPLCDGTFTRRGSLKRHMNSHSGRRDFHCSHCNSTFLNRPDMTRHQKNLHGQEGATEQTPG